MNYAEFDRLQTPIWIYDIEQWQMVWANRAALRIWNADTLDELLSRDFSDVSHATRIRLQGYLEQFRKGQEVQEIWTFYPEGTPIAVQCWCSGWELADGRIAMLVEGHLPQPSRMVADTVRSLEVLHHVSSPVSLFTLDGELLFQNPAAIACYGTHPVLSDRFVNPQVLQMGLQALEETPLWRDDCDVITRQGIRHHHLELHRTRDPISGQEALLLNETDITSLKQLEAERQCISVALEERSELYHAVLQAMAEGIVVHWADGQIVACNDSAQRILGTSPEHIFRPPSGASEWRTLHEDGTPFSTEAYPPLVTLRTGQPQTNRVMGLQKSDGPLTWIVMNVQPLRKGGIKPPYAVVVSFADITAQKNTENALRESEARWQFALEGAEAGVWDWNLQTNEVFFSSQWKAMLGYGDDEIGNTLEEWSSRIHPDDREQNDAAIAAHLRGATPLYENEHRVRCKDGTYKWILDRGKVCEWNEAGEPRRMIGTHTDVTVRHEMEHTLRRQAEMLRAIVDHIPVMLAVFDRQGRTQFINRTLEETLGWSLADWQQRDLLAECYPDPVYHQQVLDHMTAATGQWQDMKTRTAAGTIIDTAWANIRLSDGRYIGIGQDITPRKRIEEALQQQVYRDRLMMKVAQRISQSLEVRVILDTAVTETRQILGVDRVFVCRFYPQENISRVIAESVVPGCKSWKEELRDACHIAEVCENCLITQATENSGDRGQWITDIYAADLPPAQVERLAELQVRASLSISIQQGAIQWGYLVAQVCRQPRQWHTPEVEMLQQLANHLAIAIQQSELYQRLRSLNQELKYIATHDPLTGLANRRYFDEYVTQEWQRLSQENAPLSLILCDIDHFKLYNDSLGHVAGDDCLIQVARAITRAIQRAGDLVVRYGGEEFAVVLPNTNLAGATQAAAKIRQEVSRAGIPHAASLVSPQVTLSMGIACVYPARSLKAEHLIAMADGALYEAKQLGRDRYCIAQ